MYSPPPEVDNHGTASIFPDPSWTETDKIHTQRVDAVRMDEVLRGTHPKLIKLDVDGKKALAIGAGDDWPAEGGSSAEHRDGI